MTNSEGTIWQSSSEYVDEETGELLTPFQAKGKNSNYIKVGITKKTTYNANKTRGYIKYTIRYRKNPQGRLTFPGDEQN